LFSRPAPQTGPRIPPPADNGPGAAPPRFRPQGTADHDGRAPESNEIHVKKILFSITNMRRPHWSRFPPDCHRTPHPHASPGCADSRLATILWTLGFFLMAVVFAPLHPPDRPSTTDFFLKTAAVAKRSHESKLFFGAFIGNRNRPCPPRRRCVGARGRRPAAPCAAVRAVRLSLGAHTAARGPPPPPPPVPRSDRCGVRGHRADRHRRVPCKWAVCPHGAGMATTEGRSLDLRPGHHWPLTSEHHSGRPHDQ